MKSYFCLNRFRPYVAKVFLDFYHNTNSKSYSMFGEKALDLIRELHRNKDGTISPYNVSLIFFKFRCHTSFLQKQTYCVSMSLSS